MSLNMLSKGIFVCSLFCTLLSQQAFADFVISHKIEEQNPSSPIPWFTGPLLAPSGHVIPKGHVNIEPYIFYTVDTGIYSNHWRPHSTSNFYNATSTNLIQIGIIEKVDLQVVPQVVWNRTHDQNYVDIGDLPVSLDFQLFLDSEKSWNPAAKFTISANIPFGKYEHLHANKLGTDAVGSGSWLPAAGLVFSKLFHLGKGIYFLGTRLVLFYTVGTVVYVEGLNTYGGGRGTKGKVYPGNNFTVDSSIEINLTQRWVFAMDGVYSHKNKTRFSGKTIDPANSPSREQFSLAPALEYNWNSNVGLIGGVWFTFAGRNATRFTSGVIALNIYI